MAFLVKNYELPSGQVLEEAYLRVQSFNTVNSDYEYFENEGDNQVIKWKTKLDSKATIFVWASELARKNRATAIHWFQIDLDYKLSEWSNVFEQSYKKLNEIFPEGIDC